MPERPLAPQRGYLLSHDTPSMLGPLPARNRKASFACLACKQRKSKCCQGTPCKLCLIHRSPCIYDQSADQRRRVSKQRLVDEYQSQRVLLLGIIATIRTHDSTRIKHLLDLIRSETPLPEMSSYVENLLAESPQFSEACRRLSLASNDTQEGRAYSTTSEGSVQLVEGPERVSGLPMNAQIILRP